MLWTRAYRCAWSLFGILLSSAACDTTVPPERIRLELSDPILSPDPVRVAVHLTGSDGHVGQSLDKHAFSVSPEALASINELGILTCRRSGDGRVKVVIAGVEGSVALRCRLVARIDASDVGEVDLDAGPFVPTIRVLGRGDKTLDGVELSLTSKNTGVMIAKGPQLIPKSVGSATLIARAGQVSQEFSANVVRRLEPEALPLDGGRRLHFSLEPGKYRLTVGLSSPKKLGAVWRGAPYCDYSGTEQEHVITCVLRTKGGVDFDNPGYLQSGSSDPLLDGIRLHEVP